MALRLSGLDKDQFLQTFRALVRFRLIAARHFVNALWLKILVLAQLDIINESMIKGTLSLSIGKNEQIKRLSITDVCNFKDEDGLVIQTENTHGDLLGCKTIEGGLKLSPALKCLPPLRRLSKWLKIEHWVQMRYELYGWTIWLRYESQCISMT
jgi:hypothetical protein